MPEAADEGEKSGGLGKTVELGLLFGLWYLFNIYFNIYNKQVTLLSKLSRGSFYFCFGVRQMIHSWMRSYLDS